MSAVSRLGDTGSGHGCFPPRASTSASSNVYVNGGLFHEAQTYLSYIDGTGVNPDWSVTEDFSKSPYGRYTITENEDASIDHQVLIVNRIPNF